MPEQITDVTKISELVDSLGEFALHTLLPAAAILVGGMVAIRVVNTLVRKLLQTSKLEKAAHSLITSLVGAVLYILLGLMVASRLGIDVTSIIALASVLSLAVSLAVQNMLANVIGGFTLLYTQPFHSGDYVEVGAEAGTVMEIGIAYTKLQTPDNKMISIPNSTVVSGDIVNYNVTGTRRLAIDIRADYAEDSQRVIDALLDAGKVDKVLEDPAPTAVITGYSTDAVNYSLRVWTKTEDYWDVMYLINRNVKDIFAQREIRVGYPKMRVELEK